MPTVTDKIFGIFGIKTVGFRRCIRNCGLALRLYRLRDLPVLYSLFNPEVFLRANGVERRAFGSLLSFCSWVITSFWTFYLIEFREDGKHRIIGFVGLYRMRIGQTAWLSLVIFSPEDRGRGYGQKALGLLLESLQENGVVETVRVEILKTNLSSLCFFMKQGFEVYVECKDRLLLEKNLLKKPLKFSGETL